MTIWADYSAGRPGGAALRSVGFTGVIRYVGTPGHTKNITAAEYADLVAHGLQVLLVYELGTTDWAGGYNAGVSNAQAAAIDAHNCGIPTSVSIAASVDMHLNASQVPTALNYLRGFQAALGRARTGAYGFSEFTQAAHDAGLGSWWWLCGTAPSNAQRQWVTFWQRNAGITEQVVSGIACDINDQINTPAGAANNAEEIDMSNAVLPIKVDSAAGRAFATYTVGTASSYFSDGFVSLRALYVPDAGEVSVFLNFLNDQAESLGSETIAIANNTRVFRQLPSGSTGLTVDWTAQGGQELDGCIELASR
ncbi:MAG TPA: DUF1906 domain-containing protein [Pseudonocardia sp.]|jgi:hypothetical protein